MVQQHDTEKNVPDKPVITVTDCLNKLSAFEGDKGSGLHKALPCYTFQKTLGEL